MSTNAALWIPLLPLLGFVFAGLLGKRTGKTVVSVVCCGVMAVAFVLSAGLFLGYDGEATTVTAWRWLEAGELTVDLAFQIDSLSLVMLLVVTGVGSLIHVYSIGYMHDDEGYHRYFAYLNLFVFFMLVLVLAESLPVMFVGWEGVGLCSYLLIGFWYRKPSAADAGLKAFLVNRVGDFGFIVAMATAFLAFGTLSFSGIIDGAMLEHDPGRPMVTLMCFALFLAATGKSAQIPLYTWLPDAMEGPTPVSALIHAATMVTSGVYLIARLFPVFLLVPEVLGWVALIGGVTAALAATMGLVATDIKKVLAYSTISQLGYMFLALGVGAAAAGMFHLVTHAFFKACLFLGAGSVMHAVGNETDMRKMGGLKDKIPWTWATMLVATLAITGFPLLAGFVSKDAILVAATHPPFEFLHGWQFKIGLVMGGITVALTAFYMLRLYFMTFHGEPRERELHDHAHESGPAMKWVLVALAGLSLLGGWLNWPKAFGGSERFSHFIAPVIAPETLPHAVPQPHHASLGEELLFSFICLLIAGAGAFVAWRWYGQASTAPKQWAERLPGPYRLLTRKWYVDEIYGFVFVGGLVQGSRFLREWIDEIAIDGSVTLLGLFTEALGEVLRAFQTGMVRNYALMMALGAAGVVVWVIW